MCALQVPEETVNITAFDTGQKLRSQSYQLFSDNLTPSDARFTEMPWWSCSMRLLHPLCFYVMLEMGPFSYQVFARLVHSCIISCILVMELSVEKQIYILFFELMEYLSNKYKKGSNVDRVMERWRSKLGLLV